MHFDPDLVIIAPTVVALAGMAYSLIRRWMDRADVSKAELHAIDERLARIEQAVDAMSVEVERVSEGQRFATKVLSERTAERV
jgi:hypothetical protein